MIHFKQPIFFITLLLLVSSCFSYSISEHGGLVYVVKLKDKKHAATTTQTIQKRVEVFCHTSPIIKEYSEKGLIQIELPKMTDKQMPFFEELISTKAEFETLETYYSPEIELTLSKINSWVKDNDSLDTTRLKNDTMVPEYPLSEMLTIGDDNLWRRGIIGHSLVKDTTLVNEIFRNDYVLGLFPEQVEFLWAAFEEDGYFSFYMLRKAVDYEAITNKMIANATMSFSNYDSYIIHLSLHKEYHETWEKLTEKNINKSLAIVIDDRVYSAPRVMAAISGGASSISGDFSEKEASLIATLLNSGPLKTDLEIIKSEAIVVQ